MIHANRNDSYVNEAKLEAAASDVEEDEVDDAISKLFVCCCLLCISFDVEAVKDMDGVDNVHGDIF